MPPSSCRRSLGDTIREGAGDGGGAAGDIQLLVDVFQVGTYGSLGDAQTPGDLAVGVPGRQQVQQVVLPGSQPGTGRRRRSASR